MTWTPCCTGTREIATRQMQGQLWPTSPPSFASTESRLTAAGAPHKGRSALDGVEGMNMMVNMMREHIPQEARIHYVITEGGKAPNVVPNFAEVYYYARHSRRDVVIDIFDRIVKAAEGAALGTGTTMEYEMIGGTHELLPNLTLQKVMYDQLVSVGGVEYSDEEKAFADKIAVTLGQESADTEKAAAIQDYKEVGTPKRIDRCR